MSREISFGEAINEALHEAMSKDSKVLCFGLGVDDPKRIFGTTVNLKEKFGSDRVFDMPTSEAGMTGVAIGASLLGHTCIMTHQRVDFFLLAMDQLINNAAKWNYMFGGQSSPVKIVIRAIIGRGWGQGPTHSQSFQSWFAHVPGLKVVAPFSPQDAKSLLLASVNDKSPVVFLEHRWLHQSVGLVSQDSSNCEIGKAQVVRRGRDVTIVGYSLMVAEAIRAAEVLSEIGIDAEVIDLRSLRPIDFSSVEDSVNKTGRLLALDLSHERFSVASEVVAHMAIHCFSKLQASPQRLGLPDYPAPTSPALTEGYYPGADEIVRTICKMLGKVVSIERFQNKNFRHHDVPGDWFRGPF